MDIQSIKRRLNIRLYLLFGRKVKGVKIMIEIKFYKNQKQSIAYDNYMKIGECNYIEKGEIWNIVHTEVDKLYQGQGIAKKLVENVIENSKNFNKIIIADCSYAKKLIPNKLLFATTNPAKINKYVERLKMNNIEVITIKDLGINLHVEENGKDAIENAIIKAKAYSEIMDIPVFAVDDNLYIDGVPAEKQPGMFVRRVNGKRLTDDEMIEHYTGLVKEYGSNGKLTCRWVYGLAIINNNKVGTYSWSKEDFYMIDKPSDIINPGYPLNTISINKKWRPSKREPPFILSNQTRLFIRPIHLSHAYIALITLLRHVFTSLEQAGCFCRELLHD